MATQVTITTNKRNIAAQKLRAAISMAIACSKDGDLDGISVAVKQLDNAGAEFKRALVYNWREN